MTDAADRGISTYSKGMRQRVKMASALVHDPSVLLLDEPFNGLDPRQRMHLMELLRDLGNEGRTVLFSSHILEEVEQVARQIEVVVSGRHAASGDFGAIRRLMTDRPNHYVVRTSDDRALAAALLSDESVRAVGLRPPGRDRRRGARLRRLQPGAPPHRPRARHPAARGLTHRRVAGERLRLPGGPVTGREQPRVDVTVARLSLRSLLGTRRGTLLFVLPLILLAVAGLVRALAGTDPSVTAELQSALGFGTVVPLVALIAGTGILAPEMDDGSIVYLLAKPLSRHQIVISKVVVAVGVTLALTAVPMVVSSLLLAGLDGRLAAAYALGCVVGAAGYCSVFVLLVRAHQALGGLGARLLADLGGPARLGPQRRALAEHRALVRLCRVLGQRRCGRGRATSGRRTPSSRPCWSSAWPSASPASGCAAST